mgnify:CR=1 FL=1
MKYTTFRNLIVLGGLGAAVGSMYMCLRPGAVHAPAVVSSPSQSAVPEAPRPLPAQAASAAQAPVPAAPLAPAAPALKKADAPGGGEALRPLDDEVLHRSRRPNTSGTSPARDHDEGGAGNRREDGVGQPQLVGAERLEAVDRE